MSSNVWKSNLGIIIVTDFGTALETVKENMGFILKKDMSNLDSW